MLDFILYTLGATLFIGQAVYFLLFAGSWMVPTWSDRTTFPAASPDWAGTYAESETGARQH
ncbi:MAG TPA: hypothetical protein VMW18_11440 [Candidatus Binatia bacterium]|nr:hypothetical protein [Candidatus Binatia bacterium]